MKSLSFVFAHIPVLLGIVVVMLLVSVDTTPAGATVKRTEALEVE